MSALNDLMVAVADSIRAKEGSTEKIAPIDFRNALIICKLGGTSESNIEYLDVSGLGDESYFPALQQVSVYVKGKISNGQMEGLEVTGVTMGMFALMTADIRDVKAVSVDFTSIVSQKMGNEVQSMTVENMLVSNGNVTKEQLDAIPRITKEQFYDLSN
ncbi:MAG: hypothetical protein J6K33_03085 [Alistipes sp.]|nr:hypothetical protein [Alistipes sp.]